MKKEHFYKSMPFIPVLGIFLTGYFMIILNKDCGIETSEGIFIFSGIVQASSIYFAMIYL